MMSDRAKSVLAGLVFVFAGWGWVSGAPVVFGPGDAGIRIVSPVAESDFARPLAAGDFDGDGADDIVIGQSTIYPVAISHVYIIRGQKGEWPAGTRVVDLATDLPDKVLVGPGQDINMPTALASGDLNGDGIDDLAMTAPFMSARGRNDAGRVYVVLGNAGFFDGPTTLTLESPGTAPVMTFDGAVAAGDLGSQSVFAGLDAHGLAIGDLNSDGIGDLAVGAHLVSIGTRDQAGQVYVVFGRESFAGGQNYDLALADVRLDGARDYQEAGTRLKIGDVTGDGIGELIIGCNTAGEDPPYFLSTEGIVYVLKGRTAWPATIDLLSTWDVKLRGVTNGVGLGSSLAVVDMNRDGIGDLCLGAEDRWYDSSGGDPYGAMEVYYGSTTLGSTPTTIRTSQPDILWVGAGPYSMMGYNAVSGKFLGGEWAGLAASAVFADLPPSGDTNGFVEVLGSRESWAAHAVLATPADPQHDARVAGPDTGRFGFGLAAGDTNGDGVDELIIGAPFFGRGEVYVFQVDAAPRVAGCAFLCW